MVQKTPPGTLIKHKNFFCENAIFVKKNFARKKRLLAFVSIMQNLLIDGKSYKLAKSRCSENSKLVRQVYKVQ